MARRGAPRPHASPSAPVTHYGKSKLKGEEVLLAHGDDFPVTILRPPAIYGPRDSEMLAFFKIVRSRVVPFLGNAENRCSLIYASDCARAILLALTKDHPSGRIYSVEDGRIYTQREVVSLIEAALGKPALAKFYRAHFGSVAGRCRLGIGGQGAWPGGDVDPR